MYFAFAANPAQLTWSTIGLVLGGVAAIVLVIWLLGRLFPSSRNFTAAGGNALMRADVFFRASREHLIAAKERKEQKDESSGDSPPDPVTR